MYSEGFFFNLKHHRCLRYGSTAIINILIRISSLNFKSVPYLRMLGEDGTNKFETATEQIEKRLLLPGYGETDSRQPLPLCSHYTVSNCNSEGIIETG